MRKNLSIILTAFFVILQFIISTSAIAVTWPMFHLNTLHTGRTSVDGPASGLLQWSMQIGSSGSPVIADGRIYVFGSSLSAFSSAGELIWTFPCVGTGTVSPAVAPDGTIYAASTDGFLYAVNPNGTLKWKRIFDGRVSTSLTIGSDGSVYLGTDAAKLKAIRFDGTTKFTYAAGGAIVSTPAIAADGTIYFGCDNGSLYALTSTGTLKWKFTTNSSTSLKASPSIGSDGTIYIGSTAGYVYAVWPGGTQRWRFATGGAIFSSTAISSDGSIIVGSRDKYLYCINSNGTLKWKFQTGNYVDSSPAIDFSGVIYAGSNDGSVYAVNGDGTLHWAAQIGTGVTSSPAIGDSRTMYVTTSDGQLCSLGSDPTPPLVPVVTDDGAFSTSPNTLHASWISSDPESGIIRYEYAIGTSPGAQDLLPFTDVGLATSVIRSDLPLVSGNTYYFAVRATNGVNQISDVGVSDGIRVDLTPPALPVVIDEGVYTDSEDTLRASYSSNDPESGVVRYEYSVGTAPGLQDVLDWQDAGLAASQTITGLNLSHAVSYYINVRAFNGAGLAGEGSSDGIKVDLTSPTVTDILVQLSLAEMTLTIQANDPESGITKAQYAILTSPDIPSAPDWVMANANEEIVISDTYINGQMYYVIARAANGTGAWSEIVRSDAIRLDKTPPSTPLVTDDGEYWSDSTVINASWTSEDAESGIDHYAYCVGLAPGLDNVVKWTNTNGSSIALTGLNLVNGVKYYVSVLATNGVGLESLTGVSDGIILDTTPPSQPTVTDDGNYTGISDSLHASWISTDAQSGIAEYQYSIGTTPGSADVVVWTSVGTQTSATAVGLLLEPGIPYYFSVKAKNQAGLWSIIGTSDGIEYQSGVSIWLKFRCDSMNSGCAAINTASSGHLRWRVQTQGYIESSPAISGDGTVYIGSSDGKLYAVSSNGTVRWTYQTGSSIDSSPAIGSDGLIYIGSYDDGLYCIHPNGTLKWRFAAGGMIWSSPVIAADGTIYFGCMDSFLYALNRDGSLKWKYRSGGTIWSSPALDKDGNIHFGCGDGKFYCIRPDSSVKWTYDTGSAIDSSPCISKSGIVYFGSGDGYFYAVRPDGTLWWKTFMGRVVDSSAAITPDGKICVGSGGAGSLGTLYMFTADGKEFWHVDLPGGVRSSPAIDADGTIFVGSDDSKLYCIDIQGSILWSYKTNDSILASAGLSNNGAVIIGSDDGGIYCLRDLLTSDTTPPTVPLLSVKKRIITPDLPIDVSWTADDSESGIGSYSYAIGTEKGADDMVSWTNVGFTTSINRDDLNLHPGQSYYVSVIARNNYLMESGVGVSDPIIVIPNDPRQKLGTIKKALENTYVNLPGKVVTAVFEDCLFVEEADRSSGMRVMASATGLQAGAVIDIQAKVKSKNGEKVLVDASFQQKGFTDSMKPLGISGCVLKGSGQCLPLGLFVRIAGRVIDLEDGYFILTDGADLVTARGPKGIEVWVAPSDLPSKYTWVAVTGVLCKEVVNSQITTIIRTVPNTRLTSFEQ